MNDQPTEDDGKPKPVHIDELRKRAEAEGVTAEDVRKAKEVVDGINKVAGRQIKDAIGPSLSGAGDAASAALAGQLAKFNTMADKIPQVSQAGSLLGQDYEAFQRRQAQQQREIEQAVDQMYEGQRQERKRQEQLEAERVEREKENLQVAKDSRSHAKTAITIAILSLIVAILALVAGIVVPLIAG